MEKILDAYLLGKKRQSEMATDSIIPTIKIWYSEKGKTLEIVKRSMVGGLGNRRTGETDEFQGSENTLYNTIMMDTCDHTFVQKNA